MLTRAISSISRQTKDKSKQKWLDDWMAKSSHPAPHNLSSLLDSTEDWKRLRACEYGDDTNFKLCDVGTS